MCLYQLVAGTSLSRLNFTNASPTLYYDVAKERSFNSHLNLSWKKKTSGSGAQMLTYCSATMVSEVTDIAAISNTLNRL